MASRTSAAFWLGMLGITTMILSLQAGCAAHAPPKVDETRVKQFAGRGYLADNRFSIVTTFSNWTVGQNSFDIGWTVPVSGNLLPVVVYLPGLGESRSSGESWRTAWAQAGYAVLSLQLLDEDRKVRSSSAARREDFGSLARERYTTEVTATRLKALVALLAELQKRQASDETLLRRLDRSRVAIAGFDVGAYTSMLVAGEMSKGNAEPVRPPIAVAAIIALSPYADFSGSPFSTRYQSIVLPVLSVSGDEDTDAAGVVSSPSVRKAPFEYMPSHDAYLLWLANATHAVFSGTLLGAVEEPAEKAAARTGDSQGSRKGSSRREGRRSGNGPSGAAGGNDDNTRVGSGGPGGYIASPTDRAISISLTQGVTTAFLDAYLKQDPIAQEWLQRDARRWIRERGELRRK